MRGLGLARRLTLCALCSVVGLAACAERESRVAAPSFYAMPQTTEVKLAKPCKLKADGTPAEKCHFVMQISAVKVGQ
jgi:hypothetical protein